MEVCGVIFPTKDQKFKQIIEFYEIVCYNNFIKLYFGGLENV